MGDSDDDGDYKRRDKFRTERRDDSRSDRSPPPRRDWSSNGGRSGGGFNRRNNYGNNDGYNRRYSPPPPRGGGRYGDSPPPHKRSRNDYYDDDEGHGGGGYERRGPASRSYVGGGNRHGGGGGGNSAGNNQSGEDVVQPPMLSFKAYLATQDDSISDEEAIKKYAEYKLEFRRQQLNEFFVHHKDEEWFKLKYHPEDSLKRREEQKDNLLKRVEVFEQFKTQGKFAGNSLDGDKSDSLVKLLDSVVIMLEGGTEHDLLILDKEEEERNSLKKEEEESKSKEQENSGKDNEEEDKKESKEEGEEEDDELKKKAKEYLNKDGKAEKKSRKRKRDKEFNDDESSGSSSEDEDEELPPPGMDKKPEDDEKEEEKKEEEKEKEKETEDNEDEKKEEKNGDHDEDDEDKKDDEMEEGEDKKNEDRPRPLHKTASIFLRNLAPTITKQEVEAMCKRYPGFLRAAIADPQPDRRWFRRGWVTFERDVKIKEICFNLNNIRLRECELGPIVNRDLSRRIRTVNGITVDKKIVRNDIKIAAKVITNLDKKNGLWEKAPEDKEDKEADMLGLSSNNPLLKNITDYLIEEASAEEEELLGKNNDLEDGEEGEEGNSIVRDDELISVLDKLMFYLRIVHSVDFYNHSEYPNEDEMPNRCGIMHARGIPPTSNVTAAEIEDYCANFEKKMGSFINPKAELSDEEAGKLGMKNEDDEVEKFVQANTQELGKDKWLCPLSGKKFKGPDFVRKHVFNKHAEKVDEVKKEVKYYNNYLKDPKRPQLPENPKTGGKSRDSYGNSRGGGGGGDPYHYTGQPREATSYPVYDDRRESYGRREGGYDRGYRGPPRGRPRDDYGRPRGGRMGGGHGGQPGGGGARYDHYHHHGSGSGGRPIITYRDLDAPRDDDF